MKRTDINSRQLWIQDYSAVREKILLTAEALDYGTVWRAIYPIDERINALVEYFNLSDNIMQFSFNSYC